MSPTAGRSRRSGSGSGGRGEASHGLRHQRLPCGHDAGRWLRDDAPGPAQGYAVPRLPCSGIAVPGGSPDNWPPWRGGPGGSAGSAAGCSPAVALGIAAATDVSAPLLLLDTRAEHVGERLWRGWPYRRPERRRRAPCSSACSTSVVGLCPCRSGDHRSAGRNLASACPYYRRSGRQVLTISATVRGSSTSCGCRGWHCTAGRIPGMASRRALAAVAPRPAAGRGND